MTMDIKQLFFRKKPSKQETKVTPEREAHARRTRKQQSSQQALREPVIAAMRTVYDPEIHINVYDLGLIYHLEIDEENVVNIEMTLTAPACPVAEILPGQIENVVRAVDGVSDVRLELVWEPPWDATRISEAARVELGLF